jgi:integrase
MERRRARKMNGDKRERSLDGVRRRDGDGSPWLFKIRTDRRARNARRDVEKLLDPDVAGTNPWFRRRLGDLIFERTRHGGVLPTRDEVRAWRAANHDPSASMKTLGEFLDEWLRDKDLSSRYGYASRLRQDCDIYWKPLLGEIPVDQLTDGHVRDARDWLRRRNEVIREARADDRPVPPCNPDGPLREKRDARRSPRVLKPSSVAQTFVTLQLALNDAVERGYLPANPATRRKVPLEKAEREELRTWSAPQVGAFLDHVYGRGDRLAVAFQLVLFVGLRSAEVRGLRWRGVHLDDGYLRVEEQLIRRGNELARAAPKTDESARDVPLDDDTVAALRAHRRRQLAERLASGLGRPGDDDLVFGRPNGDPMPSHDLRRTFQARAAEVGNPALTLHGGRHTAATLMIANGEDAKTVAKILGHRDVKFTLNRYVHPDRDARRSAAQRQAAAIPRRLRSS